MAERDFDFGALVDEVDAGAGDEADVLAALLSPEDDDVEAPIPLDDASLRSLEEEFGDVARLNEQKARQEKVLKDTKRELAAAKARMHRAMELQGTKQFRSTEGLGSCYFEERYDTTIVDDAAFSEWVREHHPELLTVHSQTRNRLIRTEFRDKGVAPDSPDFPPGIAVTPRPGLGVRGAKARKESKSKDSKA